VDFRRFHQTPLESVKFIPAPKPPAAGLDKGVSQGAELAGSIVVFFGIGFLVDLWLDTRPLFMIALTVFAVVGQFVKMYYVYSSAMRHLEDERARVSRGSDR
jgi:F0F1-type ATP synthase assembly protein I